MCTICIIILVHGELDAREAIKKLRDIFDSFKIRD